MQKAIGTKIKMGNNNITELKSIGGMDLKADTIETTTLDSDGWKTFMQGMKDAGEVPISGYFQPADTTGQGAFYAALNSGDLTPFSILFPVSMGAEWDFNGIVTGFKTDVQLEDLIPFDGTIKVSGKPSLGLTASNGLTGLSLTGTGGTLSPTFNNSNGYYTYTGVTATSVTVTATAANHNLALYVNGNFVQNLTSGSPSSAISLPVIGSTADIVIIATENGKTQKVYEVVAVKTA